MTGTRMKIERDRPVFFEDIKHDASLWVYRHGLRNIVLAELLKQTDVFSKPSMRRQLMKEIRTAARDRMHARPPDFMMAVSANQPLMEEIRARRRRRSAVKAKYLFFKQQVHQHVERRRLLYVFQNIVLPELLKQTHAFSKPSMRRQLMKEIRVAARDRRQSRSSDFMMLVSANQPLMAQIRARRRRRSAVKAKYLRFKEQVHQHVERRRILNLFRNIVLAELLTQTHAFPKPSMRHQLMKEIRIVARSRMECKPVGIVGLPSSNHALMKDIRARGLERVSVKANHSVAMHELLHYIHAKKAMEVLHQYVSSRNLDEEMKRMLLVDLDEQREIIMFEQHQHKFQLHLTKNAPAAHAQDPKGCVISPRCIREVMLSDQRFGDVNAAA